MSRSEAVAALLALKSPGQMSTAIWEGVGWPFEQFLNYSALQPMAALTVFKRLQNHARSQETR